MKSGRLRRDRGGFTLIEVMVVVAVIGIAAVSSAPFLKQWKDRNDLRGAAAIIADVVLLGRMKAIVGRSNCTVTVDYAADEISTSPSVGIIKQAGSIDLYKDSTDPDCPSLSAGNLMFRPNGTADATGFEAVYLKSKSANIPVRYRVKILGATGKIAVEKWAGGAWAGAY